MKRGISEFTKMPTVRNKPLDCDDLEAKIRHYQDLNNQIEQKTCAVFESMGQLNSLSNSHDTTSPNANTYTEMKANKAKPTTDQSRSETRVKSGAMKNQIIVDLNQRLREIQNELEVTKLEHKKMEEERDQQREELSSLKENMKKMKNALHSKQLLFDTQKREMTSALDKLKIEEQSRKSLQKDIEKLTKQLAATAAEKEKLADKLEHSKTDLLLLKQHKIDDHPGNKVPVMLKCIRKQAFLIENLSNQISLLEQIKQ